MKTQISRRRFLQVLGSASAGGIVLAACGGSSTPTSSVATSAPQVNTQAIKDIVLRQIGTGVSNINEIKDQAKKDLGFTIDMKSLSTTENNQIAITQPKQYD